MYKDAFVKITDFYGTNLQKSPEDIFCVLKNIIPFDSGFITLSGEITYKYNAGSEYRETITENLAIQNSPFGNITIQRNKKFTEDEKTVFKTCAAIIANLIKDIELSKIINMQVQALQEGILEKNKAYKTEKNKNDILSNFSHELRTPLTAIISSSELLSGEIFGTLNEKQLEYVNDIRISGLHLLGMINDILDMTKLENHSMKLNKTEFEITRAVDEVCNIIKPLAEKKKIEIIKNCTGNCELFADYTKIQQILFNLITNAVKYTPEGGRVEIFAERKKKFIEIKVKDNGIGIDKKFHKKIFEKFMQIEHLKNSNGLGLTITKELVKLHNGSIEVESTPQKGSVFTVKLP